MTYQDSWAICTRCGERFVFRVEDQRRQAERGEKLTPPELCPSCGAGARGERRPEPRRESRPAPSPEKKASTLEGLGPGPHEGRVKWYDPEKGYGFVVHPNGEELFFHRTGIAPGEVPSFPDGTRVTFCVEQSEKGPQAADVARMDADSSE